MTIQNATFFNTEVAPRFNSLVIKAPCDLACDTAHLITGIMKGTLSLFIFGLNKNLERSFGWDLRLVSGGGVVSHFFENILHTINPKAEFDFEYSTLGSQTIIEMAAWVNNLSKCDENVKIVSLKDKVIDQLKRQVASRLVCVAVVVANIAVCIFEAAFGILAAASSIITLGTQKEINTVAYKSLGFPCVLEGVYVTLLGIINPQVLQNL